MAVTHKAVKVTNLEGAERWFPSCNSKLQAHMTMSFDTGRVTCKRCLKGIWPSFLSDEQRARIGL